MNPLKRFFIICSGAEPSILDNPRCLTERSKYAAIGATVLSTAVLASLSGGYGMYTTFQSTPKAFGFGIVWGLIIFNLDRYIVSSMQRQRIKPEVSPRERVKIRMGEFGRAVPRFLLAILISLVITRPIELKLFDREINAYVEDEKSKKVVLMQQQKEHEFPRIAELNAANEVLRNELRAKEAECKVLYELANDEAIGNSVARTSGRSSMDGGIDQSVAHTSGRPGKGFLYAERKENSDRCYKDLEHLRSRIEKDIAANQTLITAQEGQRDAAIAANKAKIDAMDGLLMRLKGHSVLTNENLSLSIASLLLVGLFILLETAPMVVKLLSKRGPYEDIVEAQEYEVLKSQQRRMIEADDEAETQLTLTRRRDAALLDADLRLRKSVIVSMETNAREQLQNARREVPIDMVERWKNAELNNFKARFETESKNGHNTATIAG